MARPRKYPPEITLEKIMDTFWYNGFAGTSLADLMRATGLKKGSLYADYGDKSGMFHEALIAYDRVAVAGMIEAMDAQPGHAALASLLYGPAIAVETGDRRGCLLCNSLAEYEKLGFAAQDQADASRTDMVAAIARALARLYGPGIYTTKALELLAIYFGLHVMARGGTAAAEIRAIGESVLAIL